MVGPDFLGCPIHGLADWQIYRWSNRVERRCLACRRERSAKTHNFGDRCRKNGHLKTPWTWRYYGPNKYGRCLPCQYARDRERRSA